MTEQQIGLRVVARFLQEIHPFYLKKSFFVYITSIENSLCKKEREAKQTQKE